MKGDFSRVSFDPAKHFSRVLMQQGRVTLEADHNEQTAIALHLLRTLTGDLFGAYGGPAGGRGFFLYLANSRLMIGAGHYYVDGILCECEAKPGGGEYDYSSQPDFTPVNDAFLSWLAHPGTPPGQRFWVYLDVWERHISWVEDDRIREVALNGPDTCTRAKVIWQVKAMILDPNAKDQSCTGFLNRVVTLSIAHMAARLDPGPQIPDPCTIAPDARYRGAENQLYRIEIHQAGDAGSATFKWSRDNGSIVTRWLSTEGNDLIVTNARGFTAGDWVELSDDNMDLGGSPGVLFKLASVQSDRLTIAPDSNKDQTIPVWQAPVNPKIRRWDQIENDAITLVQGAVRIVEMTAANPNWIDIEDGIQIQFTAGGTYRTGDYWLIPARVATGGIDWPPTIGADGQPETGPDGQLIPAALAPAGIKHHYAPLGIVPDAALGVQDCRSCNSPLAIGKCGQTAGATVAPVAIIPKATLPAASLSGNIAPKKTLTPPGSSAGGKPVSKAKQKPKG
ncbi:MAG TPA: DUF6519 domain-containing protein [Burkholderiales bacterium]|nr:DUF6519 domain-containing protein [Burkholderiales bacterium]